MSLHIDAVHNPKVSKTTEEEFAEETGGQYEGEGDAEILVLEYDEAVTIEGDLEQFACNVWAAVFGQQPNPPHGHLPLEPAEPHPCPVEYGVTWAIQQDGNSPIEAAIAVWQKYFRRGPLQPSADEACVFTVVDGDRRVDIDLSDERFAPYCD
ncbi:hypothetical protein [Nocardiopsis metallicus]|uniref:Uncharacterized protein n=1 Tax=Nocardiopsis metallicus TaxID=179819 RepID=A0A840WIQ1_9ACTN|nr:hypothetical protein [Nocardiopsis metallicus]MBB5491396.1 hypothetical protein [Nocardiopsis metallicus]